MKEMSESIAELTKALSKAQAKMKGAEKDGNNPFHKSKYVTLESTWEACRDQFAENGLAIIQTCGMREEKPVLYTMLTHVSGEFIIGMMPLYVKETTPQALGSAITYARRYGLAAIAGICPTDDDAEEAEGRKEPAKQNGTSHKANGTPRHITHSEWESFDALYQKLSEKDRGAILGFNKVSSVYDIPADKFDSAFSWMEKAYAAYQRKTA